MRPAAFSAFDIRDGRLADLSDVYGEHPTLLSGWSGSHLALPDDATHYLYVHRGRADLALEKGEFRLLPGMFASIPGRARVGGDSQGIVTSRLGYQGAFLVGGPIEESGRLRYIDGCTDSLLLSPPLCGDPCLNHLHIPPSTRQTRHTHPSLRVGIIARGKGRCVTPDAEHPLAEGLVFVIAAAAPHSFFTDEDALDVVVYHPDSDTGPTHENHPMLNRTIIGGAGYAGP
jgi:quercetin dioxygenase-like cupin family protein